MERIRAERILQKRTETGLVPAKKSSLWCGFLDQAAHKFEQQSGESGQRTRPRPSQKVRAVNA
jgi:hypothetical protein